MLKPILSDLPFRYCYTNSVETGTWNRDIEAVFEMSQVDSSIPFKLVGSERAYRMEM